MSTADFLAKRVVAQPLQEQFAALCGDRNPMHMDPVAARRTQAGQPVVHGIHTLLWALETIAAKGLLQQPLLRVRVRFLKWVYLDDEAVLTVSNGVDGASPAKLDVSVLGLSVLTAELSFGERPAAVSGLKPSPAAPLPSALDLSIEQLEGGAGDAFVASATEAAAMFPALAKHLGAAAIAEIAACSYIVGMEAPGLHSMFSKVDLTFSQAAVSHSGTTALHYEVTYTDPRFRKARISVRGAHLTGVLEVFFRVPPVEQATMSLLAEHIQPNEFAGMRALIIGGSRGLGELTAKLVAAGGGIPTITYAVGRTDAEKVKAEIVSAGGKADLLQYDVRDAPAAQLSSLSAPPTHLFYFATSTIYRPKPGVLSAAMLAEFTQFYLQGFYDLALALATASRPKLIMLYPSTVFIDERPAGMTEYAMIKAAGEQLCTDMNLYLGGLQIVAHRFPKLPTDQTAGVIPERPTDAMDAMLPVLRNMYRLGQA